jgi:cysteine desulfurase/selenocysteine lyase
VQTTRIYLDNAATSWPKPPRVHEIVDDFQRRLGVSAGRGGYAEAEEVGAAISKTRVAVARLIGAESQDRLIFTFNGTDSLNLAIHGCVKSGDHVITTVAEHNSVLRPLRRLETSIGVEVTRIQCRQSGVILPQDVRAAIRSNTRLIVVTHASNVTGAIQPVVEIGEIARQHGILYLVDAAQTVGHLPLSVIEMGADLLAAPGHKGLLGPLGTGILYIRSGIEELISSTRLGGTGSDSSSDEQPSSLPGKYESGSYNAPGIIGLGAGVEYIEQRGLEDLRQHATQLTDRLISGLSEIPGVTIYGPQSSVSQVGVVSISLADHDPPAVARLLEQQFRVQVRAGFQCAALMHRSLGTDSRQGTVRLSIGAFSTGADVDAATEALRFIASRKPTHFSSASCPCVQKVAPEVGDEAVNYSRDRSGAGSSAQSSELPIPWLKELWAESTGDQKVCIAVLDGPVDLSHPCFDGANIATAPLGDIHASIGGPASFHGTHVASIIFGQHKSSIKGVAPQCRGLILPIFKDRDKSSFAPCSQAELADAIHHAIEEGANIINISGGQFSQTGEVHADLSDAVRRARESKVLIVAAAGNQGCECVHVPGAIPSVLAVGAMNARGEALEFSNWGRAYRAQGLLALGENIWGAVPGGGVLRQTGTSFATPIVTGIAGLLASIQLQSADACDLHLVQQILLNSLNGCDQRDAKDCRRFLKGRIDLHRAFHFTKLGDQFMTQSDTTSRPLLRSEHVVEPASARECNCSHNDSLSLDQSEVVGSDLVKLRNGVFNDDSGSKVSRVPLLPTTRRSANESLGLLPAGCQSSPSRLAYTIGKLSYAFATSSEMDSMQIRMDSGIALDPLAMARYLFNWQSQGREKVDEQRKRKGSVQDTSLNLREASRLLWILEYAGVPQYALRFQGIDAKADLEDVIYDYLEQLGLADGDRNLKLEAADEGERLDAEVRPDHFAVPGITTGEMVSIEGARSIPVLYPFYDLTTSWNLDAVLKDAIANGVVNGESAEESTNFRRMATALYSYIDPIGDTPESRAMNYVATAAVEFAATTRFMEGQVALRSIGAPVRVPTRREDDLVFEILVQYYDIRNVQNAFYHTRHRVNVTEPKPRLEYVSDLGFGSGERV